MAGELRGLKDQPATIILQNGHSIKLPLECLIFIPFDERSSQPSTEKLVFAVEGRQHKTLTTGRSIARNSLLSSHPE